MASPQNTAGVFDASFAARLHVRVLIWSLIILFVIFIIAITAYQIYKLWWTITGRNGELHTSLLPQENVSGFNEGHTTADPIQQQVDYMIRRLQRFFDDKDEDPSDELLAAHEEIKAALRSAATSSSQGETTIGGIEEISEIAITNLDLPQELLQKLRMLDEEVEKRKRGKSGEKGDQEGQGSSQEKREMGD